MWAKIPVMDYQRVQFSFSRYHRVLALDVSCLLYIAQNCTVLYCTGTHDRLSLDGIMRVDVQISEDRRFLMQMLEEVPGAACAATKVKQKHLHSDITQLAFHHAFSIKAYTYMFSTSAQEST